MKPSGYRLIRRESDETNLVGGAAFYRAFRIMAQGVPGNGEIKDEEFVIIAKANGRRQQGPGCARL